MKTSGKVYSTESTVCYSNIDSANYECVERNSYTFDGKESKRRRNGEPNVKEYGKKE